MCGIIAAFDIRSKDSSVNDTIVEQYEYQYYRGTQGFGAVFIKGDGSYMVKRATEPTKALLDVYMNKSKMILFHHRMPTSTENYMDQTHPILVSNGSLANNYLVVHNGVISNDKELKKKHEGLGFTYQTAYEDGKDVKFNDSEALAIEVARYIEEQSEEIDTYSNAAFVALQIDKETDKVVKVFFGRSLAADLNIHSSTKRIEISSIGKGAEVEHKKLWSFPIDTLKLDSRPLLFKSYLKEIPAAPVRRFMTGNQHEKVTQIEEEARVSGFIEEDGMESKSTVSKNNDRWMCDLTSEDEWELNGELESKVIEMEDDVISSIDLFKEELKDHEKVFKADPKKVTREVFAALTNLKRECEKVAEVGYGKISKGEKISEDEYGYTY
jgi:predicted glutamine amidotransferase